MDVHKKSVVACLIRPGSDGRPHKEVRTFGTMTADVLTLVDWLGAAACEAVAMESTGSFWKPLYNLLEGVLPTVLVVNAAHIKQVPGRKTDVKDAEWIADLLRHGLLAAQLLAVQPSYAVKSKQFGNIFNKAKYIEIRSLKVWEPGPLCNVPKLLGAQHDLGTNRFATGEGLVCVKESPIAPPSPIFGHRCASEQPIQAGATHRRQSSHAPDTEYGLPSAHYLHYGSVRGQVGAASGNIQVWYS